MHGNIRHAATWIARSLDKAACLRILGRLEESTKGNLSDLQKRLAAYFIDNERPFLQYLHKDELVNLCNITSLTRYDSEKHHIFAKGHPDTLRKRLLHLFREIQETRNLREQCRVLESIVDETSETIYEEDELEEREIPQPTRSAGSAPAYDDPAREVISWLNAMALRLQPEQVGMDKKVESWMAAASLPGGCKSIEDVDKEGIPQREFASERFADLVAFLKSTIEARLEKRASGQKMFALKPLEISTIAYYRPMHFPGNWGIYLHADGLIELALARWDALKVSPLFDFELVCHFLVFEVFHHEFYHHLVESFAITSEILLSSRSETPVRVYGQWTSGSGADLLEEALANAYAYNAFGLANRVSHDKSHVLIPSYQRATKEGWKDAPPGYRDAGNYLGGGHIEGNADLIRAALGWGCSGAGIISRNVMPQGHTAMVQKSKVPLYLVGTTSAMERLLVAVPALREAATQFWLPYNLDAMNEAARKIRDDWHEQRKPKVVEDVEEPDEE